MGWQAFDGKGLADIAGTSCMDAVPGPGPGWIVTPGGTGRMASPLWRQSSPVSHIGFPPPA